MKRIITFLLYTLPVIIFFSYYPIIPLGASDSTNFELSLPIIWLALFFCATIIYLPQIIKFYHWRKTLLIAALPLYATLSILWSPNHLRALLTAGLLTLTFYAAATIIYLLKAKDSPLQPTRRLAQNLIKTFLIATTAICITCWLQCILDIADLGREFTALCAGCTYELFGFPHPSGFAIEPQFMGNLLLAPTILTLYLATKSKKSSKPRFCLTLLALFFAATLFLTFSRGAIYAFALALVALIIFAIVKRFFSWKLILVPLAAFCLTLCAQGLFAQLSPTNDTFTSGVTKVIHQLTLGKIDLRGMSEQEDYSLNNIPQPPSQNDNVLGRGTQSLSSRDESARKRCDSDKAGEDHCEEENLPALSSTFSGYVEDSTNIRVNLTNDALDIWTDSATNIIFGTGLGSAGTVLYENHKTASPKEIIQNQYASLLLELGLVGLLLAAAVATLAIKTFATSKAAPVLIPLAIAYAATLFFFAGLPNALQIYLLPPLLYACLNFSQTPPSHKRDNSTPQ